MSPIVGRKRKKKEREVSLKVPALMKGMPFKLFRNGLE